MSTGVLIVIKELANINVPGTEMSCDFQDPLIDAQAPPQISDRIFPA